VKGEGQYKLKIAFHYASEAKTGTDDDEVHVTVLQAAQSGGNMEAVLSNRPAARNQTPGS
jgi:hypothetical protein